MLVMPAAAPLKELSGIEYLELCERWDYLPAEDRHAAPFEPNASDWGWYQGRCVALDYSTPAWGEE
jgi:hypothetical protein